MQLPLPLLTCLVAAATAACAQMAPSPARTPSSAASSAPTAPASISAEARQAYVHVRDNILKAVDKMPEQDFSFQPTPDVRTFAQVVNHVTEAQTRICSGVIGQVKPAPAPAKTKAEVAAALKESFEECDQAYDSVNDSNMAQTVTAGLIHRSKLAMLFGNVSHDNEMYGTMSVYMRLKGVLPPSSETPPAPPK